MKTNKAKKVKRRKFKKGMSVKG